MCSSLQLEENKEYISTILLRTKFNKYNIKSYIYTTYDCGSA